MCGIAGYYGKSEIGRDRVEHCLALMRRRGPDHQAVYRHRTESGRWIYLLNSRLSIIDLDPRSNQPFRDGVRVATYNGELYNYVEVRSDLEARGQSFRTNSDTEVLLRALAVDGHGAHDSFEGMWAFAVFDEDSETLLLSRDRFGEKPLYLYEDDTGLYFASEVKFIFELLGRRLPVDVNHLYRYLFNGYRSVFASDGSFFEGVEECEPRTTVSVDSSGRRTVTPYWNPSGREERAFSSFDEVVEACRPVLFDALKIRLRADVPLAFCLSGGIDSNTLIGVAKQVFDYDVHGFTIMNTDARYSEAELIHTAVRELGIRHTEIPVSTENFLERLRVLVRQHDAPVLTITYYAHWLLMEAVADHGYRIALSGAGADELFTGYFDHHLAYLFEVKDAPARYPEALREWERHVRPLVRNRHLQDPDLFIKDQGFRRHLHQDPELSANAMQRDWHEPFVERKLATSLLRNRMLNELFYETIPVILHDEDRNAMFYSVENRSPFLDRQLFDFCAGVPSEFLIQGGYAKAILREAVRGIVPTEIVDSYRKVGFNAPILDFLDTKDRRVRESVLGEGPIYDHVRQDVIATLLERETLSNSESKFLFSFLNAKLFLEEFA